MLEYINLFISSVVVIRFISTYLTLNKVWTRKHIYEVADSNSVTASILGFLVGLGLLLESIQNNSYSNAMHGVMACFLSVFYFMLSSGYWVEKERKISFYSKFRRALRLERKEIGNILKSITKPKHPEMLIELMVALSCADGDFDKQEKAVVWDSAVLWGVREGLIEKYEEQYMSHPASVPFNIRTILDKYLKTLPSRHDVLLLVDLANKVIEIDGVIDEEEIVAIKELTAHIETYLGKKRKSLNYAVVAVPKYEKERDALFEFCKSITFTEDYGGTGVLLGNFYTSECAMSICDKFRNNNLFVTMIDQNQEKKRK